ncbi:MAG: TlpA family protein disulfide reductase [Deltaproteobacteria bacterium]|nr:TlpA family protein disulfide reductase [Deltaproteobacteria bacterium]
MPTSPVRVAGAALLALLLSAGSFSFAASDSRQTALRPLLRPGEKAPAFALSDIDGKRVSFRPEGRKPSLVVFWSAFCPLCRELTPFLNDIARRYGGSVRVVSVNLDGKRFSHAVQAFARDSGIAYPVLYDDLRGDFFIASDPYGVEKTPTAVLVDGGGTVRAVYVAEGMREMIRNFDAAVAGLKKGTSVQK